jgi:hypothetical protein
MESASEEQATLIRRTVRDLMRKFGEGQYEEFVSSTQSSGLTAESIRRQLRRYRYTPCVPPPEAYEDIDGIRIENAPGPAWALDIPVWTVESGCSDLEVQMSVSLRDGKAFVELEDLLIP